MTSIGLLENEAYRHLQMFSVFTPYGPTGHRAGEHRRPSQPVKGCCSRGLRQFDCNRAVIVFRRVCGYRAPCLFYSMIDDAQEPEESQDERIARKLREVAVTVRAELCRGGMSEEEYAGVSLPVRAEGAVPRKIATRLP